MNIINLKHIINATQYSIAGFTILVREQAARLEFGMFALIILILISLNGRFSDYLVVALLFCVTLSIESINTAIEVLVDRISPEISDFARDAKDLGSASVFFLLIANGVFLLAVFGRYMEWVIW